MGTGSKVEAEAGGMVWAGGRLSGGMSRWGGGRNGIGGMSDGSVGGVGVRVALAPVVATVAGAVADAGSVAAG